MNLRDNNALLPDIQSGPDNRAIYIDAVGIKDLRYPLTIRSGTTLVPTTATFSMTVGLQEQVKGTHMSRFIELLEAHSGALDQAGFRILLADMLERLHACGGEIDMRFPWFIRKTAPVSGVKSLVDYEVRWHGTISGKGKPVFRMQVKAPATSLCPCSKEISAYGAHNQRSIISIDAELLEEMAIHELIAIAERSASCEVYGLLKRVDEKYVTERAYENPRFVEDIVRGVAQALNQEPRVNAYIVEAENFESIHNHSAFARIARPGKGDGQGFKQKSASYIGEVVI
jgi:GTP cyclohydrolase FolE2